MPDEVNVTVLIDTREPDSDKVVRAVKKKLKEEGYNYVDQPLPVGDYAIYIDGKLVMIVERKTVSDYISSLFSGRLEEQWKKGSGLPVVVVITGSLWYYLKFLRSRMEKEGKSDEEIEKEVEKRIKVFNHSIFANTVSGRITIYAPDEDFSDWLVGAINLLKKEVEPRIYTEKKYDTLYDAQITVVGSLPGVGPVRAEELLKHFGSPMNVFEASEEELTEVPNIGMKTASMIRAVLDTPSKVAKDVKFKDRVFPTRRKNLA